MLLVCYIHTCTTDAHVVFLMIRRPPRSTLDRSSTASDVYKRQEEIVLREFKGANAGGDAFDKYIEMKTDISFYASDSMPVSYTHLRAHETVLDLVCRLLLEKKNTKVVHILNNNFDVSKSHHSTTDRNTRTTSQ